MVRARQEPRAPIGQPPQHLIRVGVQPVMHRLAGHSIPAGDIGHHAPSSRTSRSAPCRCSTSPNSTITMTAYSATTSTQTRASER